ncbi:MAG: TonB-dependent receptor [Cyclobacteriaceae bacterium]
MIRAIFLILFCFSLFTGLGQHIVVIDKETGRPISDVYVYDEQLTESQFTDESGFINLVDFANAQTLIFQHPAYQNQQVSRVQLTELKNRLIMEPSIIAFEEVVVSANKWQQSASEISQAVLSINAKEISFHNPQTSADVLSNSGQVYVQKSQFGGGSPMLRGFAANKVLLVVDGVRMNNAIYRSGNLQNVISIDPQIIDRTEVIFGPGSVIYGSDALGGVMDFSTKSPLFSNSEKPLIKGVAQLRTGSAASEYSGHADFNVGFKKIAYWGSYSFTSLGDLKAGKNKSEAFQGYFDRNYYVNTIDGQDELIANPKPQLQTPTGFDLTNTTHKLSFKLGEYSKLSYGLYYSATTNIPRYDRLTQTLNNSDSLSYAEWYYGPQKWLMNRIGFIHYKPTALFDQMKITGSYQNYQESRHDREFGNTSLRNRLEEVEIFTGSIDFEKILTAKKTLHYGIDMFDNTVSSSAFRQDIITEAKSETSTRYPNGHSSFQSAAAYTSYTGALTSKLRLNLGTRFNTVWLKAETVGINNLFNSIDIYNHAITGNAGLVYKPSETVKLTGQLSSGFRAPNVDDVGKLFELDDETIVVPNPDLKPEYVYSQELGFESRITQDIQVGVVVYHNYLNNAIVRGELDDLMSVYNEPVDLESDTYKALNDIAISYSEIRSTVNTDRARSYGGTVKIKAKLTDQIAGHTILNVNEGRDLSNQEPLRHSTPVFGQTMLGYKLNNLSFKLISDYNFKKSSDNIPESEKFDKAYLYTADGSPGWLIVNFHGGLKMYDGGVNIEYGVDNIFDQFYRTYSSGVNAPGRNLYLSLKMSI